MTCDYEALYYAPAQRPACVADMLVKSLSGSRPFCWLLFQGSDTEVIVGWEWAQTTCSIRPKPGNICCSRLRHSPGADTRAGGRRHQQSAGCGGRGRDHLGGGAGRGAAARGREARHAEDPPHDHHLRCWLARLGPAVTECPCAQLALCSSFQTAEECAESLRALQQEVEPNRQSC